MKKLILISLIALAVTFLALPATVLAQGDPLSEACSGRAGGSSVCVTDSSNPLFGPKGVITRATQLVVLAVGAASVVMILIGGFKYITSAGDSGKVNSAKDTVLYAVVGLVIALVAQVIVLFVLRRL